MVRKKDSLAYHQDGRPGKIEVVPTKPLVTQRDLSLAYSPGVADPCLEIVQDPARVWDYTARGNLVAVITDGTAVLGLGNIGPLAGKPVMEGKGCLFKKFADIDVFDLELNVSSPQQFCDVVAALEPTFGGVNLEDIRAPQCFEIERELRKRLSIPVFHDDQHGTAIISGAALLSAVDVAGKKMSELNIVISGAGAAAIACADFYVTLGATHDRITMVDSVGVIHDQRDEGMNEYKRRYARPDDGRRTLADALAGADMLLGLSVGGLVSPDMVRSMAKRPIVFALANPDPEIGYEEAKAVRADVIMATGRSDFPNQVNNVLGFPFVFRGALDVRAKTISEEMKTQAAYALAALAREPVPDSVAMAYGAESFRFGPDYLIPKPFDPRVLFWVAPAVAKAAMASGVAQIEIDLDEYRDRLRRRMGGVQYSIMRRIVQRAQRSPKRIVFPEGDNPNILRACQILVEEGIAQPILLGDPEEIRRRAVEMDVHLGDKVTLIDSRTSPERQRYADVFYELRCRKGVTRPEAARTIVRRIYFGTLMVREGDADGIVAGLTAEYPWTIRPALEILGVRDDVKRATGMYMMFSRDQVKFFADATLNIDPDAETLADTAIQVADAAQAFGVSPHIAMISFSNFGSAPNPHSNKVAAAVALVRAQRPDLEVDGEIQVDIALDQRKVRELFPFSRLTESANVLVFPSLEAGNAAYKVLAALGGARAVGPILLGIKKPVTVLPRDVDVDTIVHMTAYTVMQSAEARQSL